IQLLQPSCPRFRHQNSFQLPTLPRPSPSAFSRSRFKRCSCRTSTTSSVQTRPPDLSLIQLSSLPRRVSLPGGSSFRCAETDLCFDVKAAVTLKYEYGSWRQHLRGSDAEKWTFVGPLFNIQAEPAGAVGAVYLPHFVCLGGKNDTSEMRIGHFISGKLVLETPVEVEPFHAVLEDPSFSFLGVLWRKTTSILHLPLHSLVLIYHTTRKEPVTLHLYLILHHLSRPIHTKWWWSLTGL
uniref:FIIND domain-containing protein n=1 Tax=Apteryx owenii TaxID=8824 RepID=A0A8B9PS40_APTOW